MLRTPRFSRPDTLALSLLVSMLVGSAVSAAGAQGTGPSPDAVRMGSPPSMPQQSSREGTWPAPTAEDWRKPCLITWQRTFDDAIAVSKATTKPILVCVNMDGEIASEHYAGIRYRREETARLYEPYVCVIASVYRHAPRDYDEQGRRVPCPRFGTVTCGEHIAIEPILYERYFEGRRIAPRHIMLELDKKEVYDVYYAWDTDTIFKALKVGVEGRPPPKPTFKDDVPVVERVVSPDVADRIAVETAYVKGSKEVRRSLIEAVIVHRDVDEVDLLRLAIFGFDVELAKLARQALAKCESEAAVDLIAEALKLPMDPPEREALLAAAVRLGEKYPRARTLAAVHEGLKEGSKHVDVANWAQSADPVASARSAYEVGSRLESRVERSEAHPTDAAARLELAESFVARAGEPTMQAAFVRPMLLDARDAALEAQRLGLKGWRIDAVLAVAASGLGDRDEALDRAVAAVEGGMPPPTATAEGVDERSAVRVLALFALARQRAIRKAYREKTPWPPEWLADIHSAYAVLSKHPLGEDRHVAAHFDFLRWLGASARANEVLEEGLARFPDSGALHERLRGKILWEKGPDALESAYAERLSRVDPPANLGWFAGYASLVAAEHHRRAGDAEKAIAAYERGIGYYEREARRNPAGREDSDHYIAMAIAGRARIDLERGDLEKATNEILASFQRRPSAAASLDGLNISPVDTAKMLRARLRHEKKDELAAKIEAGLAALDPSLLELPAYEREVPAVQPGNPPRGR